MAPVLALVVFASCPSTVARAQATCSGPEVLIAIAASHPSSANYIALGNWFGNHRQFTCAAEGFRTALQFTPASTVALDGLSRSLLADGDSASVVALLTPGRPNEVLIADLGRAQIQQGMLDEAKQTLSQGLERYPSSLSLTTALGSLYILENQGDQAVAVAERCARVHPRSLEAQRFYLRMLITNGDKARAIPLSRRLIATAPHDADLLYMAGTIERVAEDYPAARSDLEKSLALDPGNAGCHYDLAVALVHFGENALARQHFEKALELGNAEPQVHYQYGLLLRTLGESEQAKHQIKLYEDAMLAKKNHQRALSKAHEASDALNEGDPSKAVALYREACEAQPQDARLAYQLAVVLDQTRDLNAESTALRRAVEIDPTFALAQKQLGDVEAELGDISNAEEHLRRAVEDAPQYTQAWISLAATLVKESRSSEARQAAANALQLEPANARALELSRTLAASSDREQP